LLDEAIEKERLYESHIETQAAEVQEIRDEFERERYESSNKRQELTEQLDNLHEQLEH
jgi:hypothetical protein